MSIRKYWQVSKNTWDEMTTYRLNFSVWRVRVVLQLLTMYFLWQAVIPQGAQIGNYNHSTILTYIIATAFLTSLVLSSRSYGVGEDINQGNLSNFLIRPINYFGYLFAKDLGDKAMNIAFSVCELTILFLLFKPPLFLQQNAQTLFLAFIAVTVALIMYFLFNLLIGFFGFWSPELWAPRFIFMILITFFAGGLFPLDILPQSLYSLFQLLPFPYLLYFPAKIYLGQIATVEAIKGIFISLAWVFIVGFLVKILWNKGLKYYTAYGR